MWGVLMIFSSTILGALAVAIIIAIGFQNRVPRNDEPVGISESAEGWVRDNAASSLVIEEDNNWVGIEEGYLSDISWDSTMAEASEGDGDDVEVE